MNIKSLTDLTSQWKLRLSSYKDDNSHYGEGYKDALSECICDMENLIDRYNIEEYYNEISADDYLSSIEAHDANYVS